MSSILRVQWTITPSTPPQPWLACSRCRDIRPFRCSEKFRLNANGKRLDAWLIYRCGSCDNTWNRPVLERRNRRDIDPAFLHALETDDPQWIRRYAFDAASLRNRAERIEEFADCRRREAPAIGRSKTVFETGDPAGGLGSNQSADRSPFGERAWPVAKTDRGFDSERLSCRRWSTRASKIRARRTEDRLRSWSRNGRRGHCAGGGRRVMRDGRVRPSPRLRGKQSAA